MREKAQEDGEGDSDAINKALYGEVWEEEDKIPGQSLEEIQKENGDVIQKVTSKTEDDKEAFRNLSAFERAELARVKEEQKQFQAKKEKEKSGGAAKAESIGLNVEEENWLEIA